MPENAVPSDALETIVKLLSRKFDQARLATIVRQSTGRDVQDFLSPQASRETATRSLIDTLQDEGLVQAFLAFALSEALDDPGFRRGLVDAYPPAFRPVVDLDTIIPSTIDEIRRAMHEIAKFPYGDAATESATLRSAREATVRLRRTVCGLQILRLLCNADLMLSTIEDAGPATFERTRLDEAVRANIRALAQTTPKLADLFPPAVTLPLGRFAHGVEDVNFGGQNRERIRAIRAIAALCLVEVEMATFASARLNIVSLYEALPLDVSIRIASVFSNFYILVSFLVSRTAELRLWRRIDMAVGDLEFSLTQDPGGFMQSWSRARDTIQSMQWLGSLNSQALWASAWRKTVAKIDDVLGSGIETRELNIAFEDLKRITRIKFIETSTQFSTEVGRIEQVAEALTEFAGAVRP
jgi:hypothetical protein